MRYQDPSRTHWPNSLMPRRFPIAIAALLVFIGAFPLDRVFAQDEGERQALDDEGNVVSFQRDIVPIFRANCLECHGADDAKADFRIDEADTVFSYVEPGDLENSYLYTDYLLSEDDDLLMPPRSHGGPLQPAEIALVRLWIEEGASWPEDALVAIDESPDTEASIVESSATAPAGLVGRVWSFQGFLHPATVHFPIALLLIGGLFVALGWKWPVLGEQIPLACLLIGSASAIVATLMGWSFATQQGYGSWTKLDLDGVIFWHRWSAVIVTFVSTALAMIAIVNLRSKRQGLTRIWKIGLLAVAAMVGAVGHQGGELTYGRDFYPKAFRILFDQPEAEDVPVTEQAREQTAATDRAMVGLSREADLPG
ncbi:MAG: c-type cytochrome domain-containing protein [Planctomycetota bacterium]